MLISFVSINVTAVKMIMSSRGHWQANGPSFFANPEISTIAPPDRVVRVQ
jgi:hypothetical protein